MRSRSALARLQQATSVGLLCCASAWLAWHWRASPLLGIAGFIIIGLSYSIFLAFEFTAIRFVNAADPAPRPSGSELARAWLGETVMAARVFLWRQPFRWRAVPDRLEVDPAAQHRRGVVLIHGFVCNRGFWTPWLERLRDRGHCFIAVNLEPVFGSIEDYVPIVERAVTRIAEATGMPPVLVCHSMGGLAARAWLRAERADARVHHVVTIGTPHHGTWLGRFSHLPNGRQMRLGSEWLLSLAEGEARHRPAFTCWYSNCDNVVFPASTATLAGASNRLVRGSGHVALAFCDQVMTQSLRLIEAA
jgi:triacylglycerol esterase/lipase EstA (alpha/beta hydrolase family)